MSSPAQRFESDRLKFPAMQVDEILVWRNWLELHQQEYDRFDYNVRIGKGHEIGPEFPENIRRDAMLTGQLRLDAVGYKGAQATIFEVKRRAGPQNVGQLLTYNAVWIGSALSPAPPLLVLVCADYSPNILPVIRDTGIHLDVVPTSFTTLAPQRLGRLRT